MKIDNQLLDAVRQAISGHTGFLCLDREPNRKHGLGGTFVQPKPEDWICLPGCPRYVWPEGKFRYIEALIGIGPRRNKSTIAVLVSDAIDRRDIADLQRAYINSL